MATVYLGVNVGGGNAADVTIAAATTSRDIEVAIDDAAVPRAGKSAKDDVIKALDAIKAALLEFDY